MQKACWIEFKETDEFVMNKGMNGQLQKYSEIIPNFPPTFKYSSKTLDFHEEKTPSWTDRVFFSFKGDSFKLFDYSSLSLFLSDHFPVFFHCEVEIRI